MVLSQASMRTRMENCSRLASASLRFGQFRHNCYLQLARNETQIMWLAAQSEESQDHQAVKFAVPSFRIAVPALIL